MKKAKRLTAVILSALMAVSAFSALPVSAAEVESNTSAVSSDENFISGETMSIHYLMTVQLRYPSMWVMIVM